MEQVLRFIQEVIATPNLARNPPARIRAAMACLPPGLRLELVCDFAEHGLRVLLACDEIKLQAFLGALDAIRRGLRGTATVQEVDQIVKGARNLDSTESPTSIAAGPASRLLALVEECCLLKELKLAGLYIFPLRFRPHEFEVADAIRRAVSSGSRTGARRIHEEEAAWQLNQILKRASTAMG